MYRKYLRGSGGVMERYFETRGEMMERFGGRPGICGVN